jgi:Ankyrin repeats (3 copies)
MTTSKSLPARPSLESLRKQAKKLARDIAAGHAEAIARARAQLPTVDLPLTQRNAQLVIAREYGYAGWQDLTAEVSKRLGNSLEWAAAQARRVIHDNDVERLKQLLAEYPALLSWQDDDDHGGLLRFATGAYGDAFDPDREQVFTRAACAELLIDAGAVVMPSVCEGLIESRARGLLQLFQRKDLLPRTLKFFAALGDLDAVRTTLDESGNDLATVNEAFVCACRFEDEAVASLLLERSIALDPELGTHVDGSLGRLAFIKYFIDTRVAHATTAVGPWKAFVMEQVSRAAHDGDVTAFVSTLQRERWLLGEAYVEFQAGLVGAATLNDRGEIITALLSLDPALLQRQAQPEFHPIGLAFTYAKTHLIPLLTRIWPLPDDLPHAAGMGDLGRVTRWFDESGAPALGDLEKHFPCNDPHTLKYDDLQWGAPTAQHVLDTALAWAVINRYFDVADFLLEHGADINTNWNSHEPASILHHLVFEENYESMRFLIDRGIDLTIKDYRWNSTAQGWALYGKKDQKMAQWLEDAERQREQGR